MENYFCARIPQEHSESIRTSALNLGVNPKNIVFSKVGCEFCSLGIYIKFEDKKTLEMFCELVSQFILEMW